MTMDQNRQQNHGIKMTKEYTEISKLFPSTLGFGDVVEYDDYSKLYKGMRLIVLYTTDELVYGYFEGCKPSVSFVKRHCKLIRKNITISMVLEAMKSKKLEYMIDTDEGEFHKYFVCNDGEAETSYTGIYWKFRKDGKDLSLYDQSEETIKLVWEVLK